MRLTGVGSRSSLRSGAEAGLHLLLLLLLPRHRLPNRHPKR
jgi:hypothetical protein